MNILYLNLYDLITFSGLNSSQTLISKNPKRSQ